MMVFQYDADGFYAGAADDFGGPMPHNSTDVEPVIMAGHVPRWNGEFWEQAEYHVGEEGYVNGKPFTVNSYGPYPEGWSADPPAPTAEEKTRLILGLIRQAEQSGERPAREIALALAQNRTPPAEAVSRLRAVEDEIAALRADLSEAAND